MTPELPDAHPSARAPEPLALKSNEGLGPLPEAMQDYPEPGERTYTESALLSFGRQERAAERERCAGICDGIGAAYTGAARRLDGQHATHAAGQRDGANECAATIRRA